MQAENFVQLELPVNLEKIDHLKPMQQAIQNMLDLIWNGVILHIPRPTTKHLMSQHGKLIAFSNGEAYIKVPSLPIFRMAREKLPDVEAAFKKAFGYKVKVSLVIDKTLN
jgi:DNA polymerase-3 subunit gamma/tau